MRLIRKISSGRRDKIVAIDPILCDYEAIDPHISCEIQLTVENENA